MKNRFCVNCTHYEKENSLCVREERRAARLERHPTFAELKMAMAAGITLCLSEGKFFESSQCKEAQAS